MEIKLRTTLAGPLFTAGAGEIITVQPDISITLIKAGYAELVDAGNRDDNLETATNCGR
jgi:hypothetical protein